MKKYKLTEQMAKDGITQEMLDDYATGESLVAQGDAIQYQAQYQPETYNFDNDIYEKMMSDGQELRLKGFSLMKAYDSLA